LPSDSGSGVSQHSGVEECFMRYRVAQAVAFGSNIPPSTSASPSPSTMSARYWIGVNQEAQRTILCESRIGTGVNDPGRSRGPRYGDAAAGRGECKKQILVNDYGPAPTR
jgi:hypothetical protein